MLTTDAIPDPPRTAIPGYTHNPPPAEDNKPKKARSKSRSPTPEELHPPKNDSKADPDAADDAGEDNNEGDINVTASGSNKATPIRDTENLGHRRPTYESIKNKREKIKANKKKYTYNSTNVHISDSNNIYMGNVYNLHFSTNINSKSQSETSAETSKSKLCPMPPNIEMLSECDEKLTVDDMLIVKMYIGHGWRDVARKLSYKDSQIEQFEENYRHSGEVVYQMLLDWKRTKTREARLGELVRILWFCGEHDCVEQLAATRKISSS